MLKLRLTGRERVLPPPATALSPASWANFILKQGLDPIDLRQTLRKWKYILAISEDFWSIFEAFKQPQRTYLSSDLKFVAQMIHEHDATFVLPVWAIYSFVKITKES